METRVTLCDETLDALQELIQALRDSQTTFIESAGKCVDADVAKLLYQIAGERAELEEELAEVVRMNDRQVRGLEGSLVRDLHLLWNHLRSLLMSSDPDALLGQVHRADRLILNRFKKLIVKTTGSAVSDVLHRQFEIIKQGQSAIEALREQKSVPREQLRGPQHSLRR